jgi:hypothetical protein
MGCHPWLPSSYFFSLPIYKAQAKRAARPPRKTILLEPVCRLFAVPENCVTAGVVAVPFPPSVDEAVEVASELPEVVSEAALVEVGSFEEEAVEVADELAVSEEELEDEPPLT